MRIPRSVRCTRQELEQLEHRVFDGAIPPAELAAYRGSRQEVSAASHDPDAIIQVSSNGDFNTSRTDDTEAEYDPSNSASFDTVDYSSGDDTVNAQLSPAGGCSELASALQQPRCSNLSKDVELGCRDTETTDGTHDDQLVSASDYLEQNKSKFGDNRCCITEDDHGVEVRSTTSPVEETANNTV